MSSFSDQDNIQLIQNRSVNYFSPAIIIATTVFTFVLPVPYDVNFTCVKNVYLNYAAK